MTLRDRCLEALELANVLAGLRAIRHGESTQDESAYRRRWPGTGKPPAYFDSFATHPRLFEPGPNGRSSAAGAYQITASTYDDFAPKVGVTAFWPPDQDLLAVAIIEACNALDDLIAGRFSAFVSKCGGRWASFPSSKSGQPARKYAELAEVYAKYGGGFADPVVDDLADRTDAPAPIVDRGTPYVAPDSSKSPETSMPLPILALISAFGPLIAEMIPQIAKAFDKKSETPAKIEAASKIIETIVTATGTANVQQAVEQMQNDPAVLLVAKNAVVTEPAIMGLLEIGGGIEGARDANLLVQNADKPFWFNPAFWFVLTAVVPPLYGVVGILLWRMPDPSEQLVTQVVTGILGLAAVAGAYYLGSTQGSAQKTAIIASQAGK